PVDSLQSAFENRIRLLNEQAESPLLLYETLEYQEAYGDSIGNQALSASAALELTKFETYHPKTKQFDYLLKAGNYENKLGNFDVGTNLHYQALDIAENLNNDTLRAKIFFRIGISFMKADNIPIAQKYLQSAIDVNTRLRDTVKLSGSYMSYGNSYKNSGVYDSALFYYQKSLDLAEIVGSVRNKAGNYNNMGNVYRIQGNYKSAINYYKKAVELNKETGNKTWLSYNYNNLGVTYLAMKQYNKALKYYQESLLIKEELGDHASKISTYENIAEIFYLKRNYRLAYENLQKAEDFKAQYQNEEKLNFTASLEAKFQNEKKEALLKQLKAEQELQAITLAAQQKKLALQDEIKAERNKMMIILLVIIISLLFALILFWRNANQKKQYVQTLHKKNNQIRSVNNDLSKAQMVLMKKNNEITDSITYAKRIQAAILPSQKLLKSTLENAFVMYLPKDIVAGDFYWTEQVNDKVLFAVADCTGHGVPGAMVSVICNSALNASIKNEGLSTPGEILDHTTEIVLKQFSKAEEDVKDGMDIALCSYHKESRILEYAGANIPLWLLRDGKVIEIKATRRPVGKHVIQQAFQTHKIEIKANDIIYLSSDGFADQFGGRRNKKYMKKNFKKLLVDVSEKSIAKQNELINTVFIDWKAENEQVDDICVMGIRFN
ncbi:MAG: tetratricopeptide repeat protein, partial [Putridiphycobacter sp.]|nr:tetratricopeptide repeat protein [Putridiphycobacter sp.]